MEILDLRIRWHGMDGLHTLVVDRTGTPHVSTIPDHRLYPEPDEPYAPYDPGFAEPRRSRTPDWPLAELPPRPPRPAKLGKPWTAEDEAILRDGYAAEEPLAALAERLGRTKGALTARLVKLGLLDGATAGLRYPVSDGPPAAGAAEPSEDVPALDLKDRLVVQHAEPEAVLDHSDDAHA